ncbi:TetR/AcrR family transcriptional regulator [Gordonia sp. HY002]|uniref:TetR/AcrR family transcriptional regulator n=1 Tax=Gordonia zhenghanii TaxID=2911516 RepID=UPI001EEF826B|nr:helix-turn-helix domain-containing protein [Gordonia zhenghanii]MCF8569938.1 TetR/AcrR family transcriptional regulator [Gordonia zhenghanii]MCF8605105.1 TetR/AcrR family transcriptional regulator [Gordonia zhenghanii]
MDAAEQLAVESGPAAVTVRSLSELTSVSNGAIYHAFGSRAGLMGRVWVRAARAFLALQTNAVAAAFNSENASAVDAVVAAADAPAQFLLDSPRSGRFLLVASRNELLGSADIPAEVADDLRSLDTSVTDMLIRLSEMTWGRADREAVAIIKDCVVELPSALLLRGERTPDPLVRERLAYAVRAVLKVPPPERVSLSTESNDGPKE